MPNSNENQVDKSALMELERVIMTQTIDQYALLQHANSNLKWTEWLEFEFDGVVKACRVPEGGISLRTRCEVEHIAEGRVILAGGGKLMDLSPEDFWRWYRAPKEEDNNWARLNKLEVLPILFVKTP